MRSRLPARDRYEKSPFKTKGSDIFTASSRPRRSIFKCHSDQREPKLVLETNFIRYANCESCVLIRPLLAAKVPSLPMDRSIWSDLHSMAIIITLKAPLFAISQITALISKLHNVAHVN